MQFVNDDMDDLFRLAADNYPLDVSRQNWKKVSVALHNQKKKSNINHRKLLWIFCVVPASLAFYYFGIKRNTGLLSIEKESTSIYVQINTQENKKAVYKAATSTPFINMQHKEKSSSVAKSKSDKSQGISKQYWIEERSLKVTSNSFINKVNFNQSTQEHGLLLNKKRLLLHAETINANQLSELQQFNFPGKLLPRILLTEPPVNAMNEKSLQQLNSIRRFYVHSFSGLDKTTIHFQKANQFGRHIGGLFGMQWNKRFSVEAGAVLSKKYYYTAGTYFNTSKMYLPQNTKITEVSGACNMIEIPIVIKYNFSAQQNSGLFASVGFSSYFIKKETYDYVYYYNTTGTQATRHKTYSNATKNIFAAVQLSQAIPIM